MASNCRNKQYGTTAKGLHWIVTVLILFMIPLGYIMEDFTKAPHHFYGNVHKSTGIIILALVIFRVVWRLTHKPPTYDSAVPKHVQIFAKAAHTAIYLAILIMPLSGWIMSTASNHPPHFLGWFTFPMPGIPLSSALSGIAHDFHNAFAWVIIVLVALHILAAFGHQCICKDKVLNRMMPRNNPPKNKED